MICFFVSLWFRTSSSLSVSAWRVFFSDVLKVVSAVYRQIWQFRHNLVGRKGKNFIFRERKQKQLL